MEFLLDNHSHTLASGHAYCTLLEMVRGAAEKGLKLLCITDHAPGMEGTTHWGYFMNMRTIDRTLFGVEVLMGAELNIMDWAGTVDLEDRWMARLDLCIASLHALCLPEPGTKEACTNAVLAAMDSPYVNIIGHPDDGFYPLDYPAIVRAAGEKGVLLEVNNSSLAPGCNRVNTLENCTEILKLCKAEGVRVVVGSDAHFATQVGEHSYAEALLKELEFPEELVMNRDPDAFKAFIAQKRGTAQ